MANDRTENGSARRAVLITRPAAEAAETAARVQALGFVPIIAPLLAIVAEPVRWPGHHDGVVLTSGNALPGVAGLERLPLLAVGDATAAKARAAGFEQVCSAHGDMTALAAAAPRHFPPGATLAYPTARGEGLALATMLRDAGYVVDRRVAYAVEAVDRLPLAAVDALASGRLRAALFLSARTARVFRLLLPGTLQAELAAVDALAIGDPAAAELTPLPWRRVRVSLAPTLDQVLALL